MPKVNQEQIDIEKRSKVIKLDLVGLNFFILKLLVNASSLIAACVKINTVLLYASRIKLK